ncbi:TetR/AcrR family transcriptional regulator [Streptomyces malaysiensis subsp. malaysiensis]
MTELEKGPKGRRRGRGARERILSASQQLFREQGINRTGMDQLCAAAEVSKRTAYQHFTGKDELVAEYLRRFDPSVLSGVFDRTDLTPRERLLAAFDVPSTTPCAPTSPQPSNSTTPSTPHPSAHATTRKPSPRGSPTPPAKPAPPTPNSSASSSRCSSTAPRPAPGSSTPTPSPPPPPSPPSSSTTPSPPRPAMTGDGNAASSARSAGRHHESMTCEKFSQNGFKATGLREAAHHRGGAALMVWIRVSAGC